MLVSNILLVFGIGIVWKYSSWQVALGVATVIVSVIMEVKNIMMEFKNEE